MFAIFGMEHYRAVLVVQMFVDIGTCFLIADMARRLVSPRAAKAAFLLAALCPFLASYAAAALTETLEIFFTALALDFAIAGLDDADERLRPWLGCGLAIGGAILLRPDGGLLLVAIELYLAGAAGACLESKTRARRPRHTIFGSHLIAGWADSSRWSRWRRWFPGRWRNLHTLHRFQPLAPRYANEEDEFVPAGFNRWVKTWMADYASVEEIYWPVPGDTVDADKLPARAFDSEAQRQQTDELLADYNQVLHVTPELDARFAALAERAHPARAVALLRVAAAGAHRRHVAASAHRNSAFRHPLVGIQRRPEVVGAGGGAGNHRPGLCGSGGCWDWRRHARSRFWAAACVSGAAISLFWVRWKIPSLVTRLECYPVVIILAAVFLGRTHKTG